MNRQIRLNLFFLLLLLLAVLAGAVVWARGLVPSYPPYHPNSLQDDGTQALELWLQEMGYDVQPLPPRASRIPQDVDMLILFPGKERVSAADAAHIYDWVLPGRTLVLVDMQKEHTLNDEFGVSALSNTASIKQPQKMQPLVQAVPLLPQAPASLKPSSPVAAGIDIEFAPQAVAVLKSNEMPVAVVQQVGTGYAWHLAAAAAPTNRALQEDMGYLIPAILRSVPARGKIILDLYHPLSSQTNTNSQSAAAAPSLFKYLFTTAWGWAALLAGLMTLLFLILQGKRLGPPLAASHELSRREAAEYVRAMAQLKRRARQRDAVARHHSQRLRAGLANIWHIDPQLPGPEFISALQHSSTPPPPELLQEISATLAGLASSPSEAKLVQLTAQVDAILHQLGQD